MTTPFKWGAEFLVSTPFTSSQFQPTITALDNGKFVVAWTDASQTGGDPSGYAVRAQVFDADGSVSGAAFLVNTTVTNNQSDPTVAALTDGRFVVTWTDDGQTGGDLSGFAIRAQIFLADGTTSGAEFLVNTTVTAGQFQPSITVLANGSFVAAWTDFSNGTDSDIRAQVFNADGSALGAEFMVNTTVASNQRASTVTALADGRFVVAWSDGSQAAIGRAFIDVRAQVFNANGSKSGAEFVVNTTVSLVQPEPTITALADGRFVVAWTFESQSTLNLGFEVLAQVFNADGSASGAEFPVNTSYSSNGDQYNPTITALADGRFVAAWTDFGQTSGDPSGSGIRAQVFNADGSLSGAEFLVNTTVTNAQHEPSITALADGRFVVAWTDDSNGTDVDIRAQIFDPREVAVSLNGTLVADDFVGTAFSDQIAGFFGDDTLAGAGGDDRMYGEFGDDDLRGGNGNDRLNGDDGDDRLAGGAGSDGLDGGAGNDSLNGGFGSDAATGGAGNDVYSVDQVNDLVIEAAGAAGGVDRVQSADIGLSLFYYANVENAALTGSRALHLFGSAGANVLSGNSAVNLILGGDGNDRLNGNGGADQLYGDAGNDTLRGGTGQDLLTGGAGSDVFVFAGSFETGAGALRDRITDFQAGVDRLDLSAFMAGGLFIGNAQINSNGPPNVRYNPTTGLLVGDQNSDGQVDFALQFDGSPVLTAADFLF